MKIAAAQISCALGDVDTNLAKMRDYAARAKEEGAALIVFPEMADTGYAMATIQKHAATWESGAVPALREVAKKLSLALVAGVSEREGARIFNTQVFINEAGEIAAKYRKVHLFAPPPVEEHHCFTAGHEFTTVEQGGFHFGLSICYDLRFPEVYRQLAGDEGANVLLISSAWPLPRVEHLRVLATARAIENQSYVILANRVGTDDGLTFCGHSMIIDPAGAVLAVASVEGEALVTGELSQVVLDAVRTRMPVFAHRRAELYGARPR